MLRNLYVKEKKDNVMEREIRLMHLKLIVSKILIESYLFLIKPQRLSTKSVQMIWLNWSLMLILHLQLPWSWRESAMFSMRILKSLSNPKSQDQCRKYKISGHIQRKISSTLNWLQESRPLEKIKLKLFQKEISISSKYSVKNHNLRKKTFSKPHRQQVVYLFGLELVLTLTVLYS